MNYKKQLEKIGETMTVIFKELADDNPGCMIFLMNAIEAEKMQKIKLGYLPVLLARAKLFDIKGGRLYKVWNDCCNQNAIKAINILCENSIDDILAHINDGGKGIPYED